MMSNTPVPILVMELLETSLTSCLKTNGILPVEISYSIISDITTALCYMHGQTTPIIHRDLTANNILLTTDMRAKISDLGMAKILNLSAAERMQMTTCPGAQSYMPPEALSSGTTYGCIDIFAFGVLILHLFCGEWPLPGEANRVDPLNPSKLVPLTEAERRAKFFDLLGSYHPLAGLIRHCLSNHPPYRPTADQVLTRVCQARAQICPPAMNKLQMLAAIERVTAENQKFTSKVGNGQECVQDSESQQLRVSLGELTVEKDSFRELLSVKEDRLAAKSKELKAMEQQVDAQRAEIAAQEKEISLKEAIIEAKEETIKRLKGSDQGLPFHLYMENRTDLPHDKQGFGNPNCTVHHNTVFVGAGHTEDVQDGRLVYCYNQNHNSWHQLPLCPQVLFGLGILPEGLVAVGGLNVDKKRVLNTANVFDYKDQTWKMSIPAMPTPRFRPTVISHTQAIAVSGGISENNLVSDKVDVFISGSNCWTTASPLLIPCCLAKPLVIGDHCYLVGGYSKWRSPTATRLIQIASLSDIFSSTNQQHERRDVWKSLPEMPNDRPVPVSVAGALVVIGGSNNGVVSNAIFTFSVKKNNWIRIGTWPQAFRSGGSVILPSGECMVVGGISETGSSFKSAISVSLKPH